MKILKITLIVLLYIIFCISCESDSYSTHKAMLTNNSSVTVYNVELKIRGTDKLVLIDSLNINEDTDYYAFRFIKSHTSGCTTTSSPSLGDFYGEYTQNDSLKYISIIMPYNNKKEIKIKILDDCYIVE